jgi:hypothetical protein
MARYTREQLIILHRLYLAPTNSQIKLGVIYHDPSGSLEPLQYDTDRKADDPKIIVPKKYLRVDTDLTLYPQYAIDNFPKGPMDAFLIYTLSTRAGEDGGYEGYSTIIVCVAKGIKDDLKIDHLSDHSDMPLR